MCVIFSGIGQWLQTVYTVFVELFKNPISQPKFQMYCGHDVNIFIILEIVGLRKRFHLPSYASSLYLELWNRTGTPTIEIWHKDDAFGIFEQIKIRECGYDCSLSDFKRIVSKYFIDPMTWKEECNANFTTTPTHSELQKENH